MNYELYRREETFANSTQRHHEQSATSTTSGKTQSLGSLDSFFFRPQYRPFVSRALGKAACGREVRPSIPRSKATAEIRPDSPTGEKG